MKASLTEIFASNAEFLIRPAWRDDSGRILSQISRFMNQFVFIIVTMLLCNESSSEYGCVWVNFFGSQDENNI